MSAARTLEIGPVRESHSGIAFVVEAEVDWLVAVVIEADHKRAEVQDVMANHIGLHRPERNGHAVGRYEAERPTHSIVNRVFNVRSIVKHAASAAAAPAAIVECEADDSDARSVGNAVHLQDERGFFNGRFAVQRDDESFGHPHRLPDEHATVHRPERQIGATRTGVRSSVMAASRTLDQPGNGFDDRADERRCRPQYP